MIARSDSIHPAYQGMSRGLFSLDSTLLDLIVATRNTSVKTFKVESTAWLASRDPIVSVPLSRRSTFDGMIVTTLG